MRGYVPNQPMQSMSAVPALPAQRFSLVEGQATQVPGPKVNRLLSAPYQTAQTARDVRSTRVISGSMGAPPGAVTTTELSQPIIREGPIPNVVRVQGQTGTSIQPAMLSAVPAPIQPKSTTPVATGPAVMPAPLVIKCPVLGEAVDAVIINGNQLPFYQDHHLEALPEWKLREHAMALFNSLSPVVQLQSPVYIQDIDLLGWIRDINQDHVVKYSKVSDIRSTSHQSSQQQLNTGVLREGVPPQWARTTLQEVDAQSPGGGVQANYPELTAQNKLLMHKLNLVAEQAATDIDDTYPDTPTSLVSGKSAPGVLAAQVSARSPGGARLRARVGKARYSNSQERRMTPSQQLALKDNNPGLLSWVEDEKEYNEPLSPPASAHQATDGRTPRKCSPVTIHARKHTTRREHSLGVGPQLPGPTRIISANSGYPQTTSVITSPKHVRSASFDIGAAAEGYTSAVRYEDDYCPHTPTSIATPASVRSAGRSVGGASARSKMSARVGKARYTGQDAVKERMSPRLGELDEAFKGPGALLSWVEGLEEQENDSNRIEELRDSPPKDPAARSANPMAPSTELPRAVPAARPAGVNYGAMAKATPAKAGLVSQGQQNSFVQQADTGSPRRSISIGASRLSAPPPAMLHRPGPSPPPLNQTRMASQPGSRQIKAGVQTKIHATTTAPTRRISTPASTTGTM